MVEARDLTAYKEKVTAARNEFTRAQAVMEEVKTNIEREFRTLTELGIDIQPLIDSSGDDEEIYTQVLALLDNRISEISSSIEEDTQKVRELINNWR